MNPMFDPDRTNNLVLMPPLVTSFVRHCYGWLISSPKTNNLNSIHQFSLNSASKGTDMKDSYRLFKVSMSIMDRF
jgi:hypothetical protein